MVSEGHPQTPGRGAAAPLHTPCLPTANGRGPSAHPILRHPGMDVPRRPPAMASSGMERSPGAARANSARLPGASRLP